jgi:di/tricarboxylate transporter
MAYETNILVYGAGGYRFLDFSKIGMLLNIVRVASMFAIGVLFPI